MIKFREAVKELVDQGGENFQIEVRLPLEDFQVIEEEIRRDSHFVDRLLGVNTRSVTCIAPDKVSIDLTRDQLKQALNILKDNEKPDYPSDPRTFMVTS